MLLVGSIFLSAQKERFGDVKCDSAVLTGQALLTLARLLHLLPLVLEKQFAILSKRYLV